jgi:hypothetical protein
VRKLAFLLLLLPACGGDDASPSTTVSVEDVGFLTLPDDTTTTVARPAPTTTLRPSSYMPDDVESMLEDVGANTQP